MMLYQFYDLQRLALQPMRAMVSGALSLMEDNPLRETPFGRLTTAALDSFEHTTRTFVKPAFGHTSTADRRSAGGGDGRDRRIAPALV